jgi:hypothetical protein
MVAQLPHTMSGNELAMRVYLDGDLVNSSAVDIEGEGDVWGFSPGPLFTPGTWRYEITDIGGNVLASGEVQATE